MSKRGTITFNKGFITEWIATNSEGVETARGLLADAPQWIRKQARKEGLIP